MRLMKSFYPACFVSCVCLRFKPAVTLLKLNTAVDQDLSASLSLSLVDLLAVHRPTLDRLMIVTAVQPPKRHQVHTPRLSLCCQNRCSVRQHFEKSGVQ